MAQSAERIAALRAIAPDRLRILCGVDDEIVEAVYAGDAGAGGGEDAAESAGIESYLRIHLKPGWL
jgi:hypothetical protein